VPDAEDIKRRVLEKAAARAASRDASKSNLSARYKMEAIEAAIAAAQSTSHKKKTGYTAAAISAIAAGNASNVGLAHTQEEVRLAHDARPSLCFLPLEDGGLRFASVSFAQVPRSVHALCQTNLLCGACLHPFQGDAASASASAPVVKVRKNAKKRPAEAEADRHQRVAAVCGAVTYPVHKQCEHAVHGDFLASPTADPSRASRVGERKIILAETYMYDEPDDAECDLCGRKGGIMRYFQLSRACSSVPQPAEEGWLAHIPCIQFLHASSQLTPLAGEERSAESSSLPRFDANPWSCRISAAEEGNESSAVSVPTDTVATPQKGAQDAAVILDETTQEESAETKVDVSESDPEADGDGADEALQERLLRSNLLRDAVPLSVFDQQLGQWRCTLCGLQCGMAARCMGAGCALRAHPLCVTVAQHPLWRMCAVSASGDVGGNGKPVSVGVLCPLHSVALQK
jgi:hypothetical protein